MQCLIDAGALVNTEDDEGNSPLHVKCFGETNKPTETGCIELLIQNRARLLARNQRVIMLYNIFITHQYTVGSLISLASSFHNITAPFIKSFSQGFRCESKISTAFYFVSQFKQGNKIFG